MNLYYPPWPVVVVVNNSAIFRFITQEFAKSIEMSELMMINDGTRARVIPAVWLVLFHSDF